jgi:serine/threonine protein kinase
VSHPHTVYIYSSEEIAGMPVIAMELLPGGTLKDRVEKQGPLAPIEAIDAMLQVVSGLEAAHAAGILHRDIKPSNCFVDADGTIKIGDFGLSIPTLARDVTQLTVTGAVQGTPQFASPEQLCGHSLDVRSDIYAVGATLYYLLTGRPPFDDRDLMVLVSRIATEHRPRRERRGPRSRGRLPRWSCNASRKSRPIGRRVIAFSQACSNPLVRPPRRPCRLGFGPPPGPSISFFPPSCCHGPCCFLRDRRRRLTQGTS